VLQFPVVIGTNALGTSRQIGHKHCFI